MANPLRTLFWNAHGLKNRLLPLRAVLKEQDVDVALICETFLSPNSKIHVPGYHIYRLDDTTASTISRRGLAVLVRRRLPHQVLPHPNTTSFQALGIELLIAGRPHRLYSVYRPPGQALNLGDVHEILNTDTPTAMAGDWNAKSPAWNSSRTCPIGRQLQQDAEDKGYDVTGPETPTYYPFQNTYAPDVLDIVVLKGLQQRPALEVYWDAMESDHLPVLALYHPGSDHPLQPSPRKAINWRKFEENLQKSTPTRPVTTAADVDSFADELTSHLAKTLSEATSSSSSEITKMPLPQSLRKLLERKKRLRRLWQTTRCPTLKTQLNHLGARIRVELYNKATEEWDNRIEAAWQCDTSVHKLCRQLTRTPEPIRPLLHADGNLRYRAEDRAEILADHLEQQFKPNDSSDADHTQAIEQAVAKYFATPPMEAMEDKIFFSPGMVKSAIAKSKPRKAPGADGITNTALRHLPRPTIAAVTRLYNGILRTGHFPAVWKLGIVIMLPKPGKNYMKPESYRPITLLPTLSKIFEVLVLRRAVPHLTPREEQFGFRAEHSTTQQLARVLHLLTAARNKHEKAAAVFLDMEKAFDRVWHAGLIYKVITSTTTPLQLSRIFHSFLQERSFRVRVDRTLSSTRPIQAGVPQGSCLSPVLYSCYTDDIPASKDVTLALYADDAAYVATSLSHKHARTKLQRSLDALPEWLGKWRLSANARKTQAICMGSHFHNRPPPLTLLGESIPWSTTVKYLGLTIDQSLTMKPHTRLISNQTRTTVFALRPILRSRLPLRTKLGVYKTYIRSRLTYAAPAWFALASESTKKKMKAQQSTALRLLTDAPRYVRNSTISRDLRIESLDQFAHRLATKVFTRADVSQHPHIRDLAPWHARPPDKKAYPRDLLNTN